MVHIPNHVVNVMIFYAKQKKYDVLQKPSTIQTHHCNEVLCLLLFFTIFGLSVMVGQDIILPH
jgi:hypothetical protein